MDCNSQLTFAISLIVSYSVFFFILVNQNLIFALLLALVPLDIDAWIRNREVQNKERA